MTKLSVATGIAVLRLFSFQLYFLSHFLFLFLFFYCCCCKEPCFVINKSWCIWWWPDLFNIAKSSQLILSSTYASISCLLTLAPMGSAIQTFRQKYLVPLSLWNSYLHSWKLAEVNCRKLIFPWSRCLHIQLKTTCESVVVACCCRATVNIAELATEAYAGKQMSTVHSQRCILAHAYHFCPAESPSCRSMTIETRSSLTEISDFQTRQTCGMMCTCHSHSGRRILYWPLSLATEFKG